MRRSHAYLWQLRPSLLIRNHGLGQVRNGVCDAVPNNPLWLVHDRLEQGLLDLLLIGFAKLDQMHSDAVSKQDHRQLSRAHGVVVRATQL